MSELTGGTVNGVWSAVGAWWSGVELWLTQLPFAAQVALVLVVLLPLCFGAVAAVDRLVDAAADRIHWRPAEDHPDMSGRGANRGE